GFCLVLQIVHQRGEPGDEISSAVTPTPKIADDFTGLSCFCTWSAALAAKLLPCCCASIEACWISVAPVGDVAARRRFGAASLVCCVPASEVFGVSAGLASSTALTLRCLGSAFCCCSWPVCCCTVARRRLRPPRDDS